MPPPIHTGRRSPTVTQRQPSIPNSSLGDVPKEAVPATDATNSYGYMQTQQQKTKDAISENLPNPDRSFMGLEKTMYINPNGTPGPAKPKQ